MKDNDNLIRVFTGTVVSVNILKDKLEEIGIIGMIKDDFQSGNLAGFGGGNPSAIDFYIQNKDLNKAKSIISDFIENN